MKSVSILQARTNSTRLPGKVLLPICGFPIAVLSAKRASNTGRKVILATSIAPSDDGLAEIAKSYELDCFRGSLENTLDRIVSALSSFDDETLIFRLTGDNVFPDGALLDEMEAEFINLELDYLCCNGEPSGLPYGVSAELTRLKHLREANREAVTSYDREHVTPFIVRRFGFHCFKKYGHLKKSHYRCTIDSLDDYLCVERLFAYVDNPVDISIGELIQRLEGLMFQPVVKEPARRLVLGTAQLGLNYGVANELGQPLKAVSQTLIKTAVANGITYIDTARAYGESEQVLGSTLAAGWQARVKIVTKLAPLVDCPSDASDSILDAFVEASIYRSMAALQAQKIEILLLHRAAHIVDWNGRVWKKLLKLKETGVIGALGVSVQSPAELIQVLHIDEVSHIQLPFNLLDWRWNHVIPKILKARASRNLVIHVRSVFLQGLFLTSKESHWLRAKVSQSSKILNWLDEQVKKYNRTSVADLCFGYVNAMAWVDGIAVGMENLEQLHQNLALAGLPPLTAHQIRCLNESRPKLSEASLNPASWGAQ